MKILITNDDGIGSNGIIRLSEAAKKLGDVWVVAPESQRSAQSHRITLRHSFDAWEEEFPVEGVKAYACSGTPADCVRIGVLNIVPGKPDLVLSGINYGFNVATDLQYSATAGAAFEAAFQGIHTIAFSEDACDIHEVTDRYLQELLEELAYVPIEHNQIWNVNFPGCPLSECKGILRDRRVCTNRMFYKDTYDESEGPDGRTTYMVNGKRNFIAEEDTDLKAVFENYVSVGVANNIT